MRLVLGRVTLGLLFAVWAGGSGSAMAAPATGEETPVLSLEHVDQTVPPDLVAFGQDIAADLRAGRGDPLASLFLPVLVACPQFQVDGALIPLCQGVQDGTTLPGCLVGRIGSDAGWTDCESNLPDDLASVAQREFRSTDLRLFTVALTGRDAGSLGCPECAMLVFSSPADAEYDTEPTRPGVEANVAYFQVIDTPGGLKIHSYAVGHIWSNTTNFAILNGGVAGGQEFFRVSDPGAPHSGTGLNRASASRHDPALPVLLAAALALLGASARLFAIDRRRRSR